MVSYAYIHCKPDGTPFYVGKGALRRAKYLGDRNHYHQATVAKYGRSNILIGMLECSTDKTALSLEVGIIKCMKRMGVKLTNFTDGGEGTVNPCAETRKRLSKAAKKRGVSEACQKAKVAAKKGKPLSDEQKAKQSVAMKGIKFTEDHRRNISISAKKRGMSEAVIAAAKLSNKGRKHSETEREKRRASMISVWDAKGRKPKQNKPKGSCWDSRPTRSVYIDDLFYSSLKSASIATGISSSLIIHALKGSKIAKGKHIREGTE